MSTANPDSADSPFDFRLEATIPTLTDTVLARHSRDFGPSVGGYNDIQPKAIELNQGSFTSLSRSTYFPTVVVKQTDENLLVSCSCEAPKQTLCSHQVDVLTSIMRRRELRLFFDPAQRQEAIKHVAKEYGLENEPQLDDFFQLVYDNKTVSIQPRQKQLIPVTKAANELLEAQLVPQPSKPFAAISEPAQHLKKLLVFTKHRHHDHFCLELFDADSTRNGKPKNPLKTISPLDIMAGIDNPNELKFYSAVARFQNPHRQANEKTDIDSLRLVVANPLRMAVFYHSNSVSENVTSHSLVPINVALLKASLRLTVRQNGQFYEVSGLLAMDGATYELHTLTIRYDYFLLINDTFYLTENTDHLRIIRFLGSRDNTIIIHQSKYDEFRETILAKLEDQIPIQYAYLKPATAKQLAETGFDQERERIIYLADGDNYVILTPAMRYGPLEVPVLSKRQIYSVDRKGRPFTVHRDEDAEVRFTMMILSQHPDFHDQLDLNHFYLHKKHFLDETWLLDAVEYWHSQGIQVLGFNTLKNNKLNPHKAKVSVVVNSGLDWFETALGVSYGKQQATLNQLRKAVKNRSRYVMLDDGSQGLLPTEWLDRFAAYFQQGDVVDEQIRTPKIRFDSIRDLYDENQLSPSVSEELTFLTEKFADFTTIRSVAVPSDLHATLRDYQREGLNWLNFLDDLGFGGCLADDMGLGKTLQIIAFLLLQRSKRGSIPSLIVVPTSLLFNWQAELTKFAPSLSVYTFYGGNRTQKKSLFDQFDVVLTSYGTLLSDVRFLKDYPFNYIVLDESQAIKNPDSQRYQAVRRLQSRNKLVLTGTPIENNTFDLYGQLSFACPGLLGSYTHFKAHYSTPIDKFDDRQRAKQLQRRISPFILRRTKAQVAPELPEKTEMILYCDMGPDQRKVYDAYEREFRHFLLTTQEGDIPRVRLHVLQGLTKLRQICNSPALLNDDDYYGSSSAKVDMLIEQISTKSPEHKILIFSQFVAMLDLIRTELATRQISFEYLTGQTRDREASVSRFQTDNNVRVFLISLKAGGTGLNLTEADYVYLIDPWWNPAVENQAIDRSHRIGQSKHVIAVRLICPNTIEEKIQELQQSKQERSDTIIKTDDAMLKSLSRTDLLNLLGPASDS
ncbi:hypothetical protein GCM10028806_02230 [Spirosoma terrae]|uniref:DEAD/DEAH box helicase family protein n=1 Tax=Spirosoma terrae TaxID=1968276 RepID=A0A6L9L9V7_9BACT|nr:DEAD/DEAH box helicase [Spirosoma terrae]NDU96182.1 DEAD/DEAH box helicase family protein [Spirosoma terrae]